MNYPIIGIAPSLEIYEKGPYISQNKLGLNCYYIEAISLAGGIPLILPIVDHEEQFKKQMSLIDGLLLCGGDDVHPLFYGEEPQPALGSTFSERDRHELRLIEHVKKVGKPMLGICRGMQLLNVAFGGTLYQDIPQQFPAQDLCHLQNNAPSTAEHKVLLTPGTLLHQIFDRSELHVNSLHHQGIKKLAPSLRASAHASDGMIEAVEGTDGSFLLGIQWHPEQMIASQPAMQALFEAFASHCAQIKRQAP